MINRDSRRVVTGKRWWWGCWVLVALAAAGLRAQTGSTNIVDGEIGVPGEEDRYTFSVSERGLYYFDALTNLNSVSWSLAYAGGAVVVNLPFSSSDGWFVPTPVRELNPGNYTLTVAANADGTNRYRFRFVNLNSAALVVPGTVVAGTLAPANETHLYQFTAAAGDRYLFDRLTVGGTTGNLFWRLVDPYGNEVFAQVFNDVTPDPLPMAGTYTLLVEGYISDTGTGTYSFNIVPQGNVPPVPYPGTPLVIGQTSSGSLTNASTNQFAFTLTDRRRLMFDALQSGGGNQWTLEGPAGVVVNQSALNGSDGLSGSSLLDLIPGNYQLRVRRTGTGTNGYAFRLLDTSNATPINVGVTVADQLVPVTATKLYRFEGVAGERVYFDFRSTNQPANAYWRVFDPHGTRIEQGYVSQDRGPTVLPLSGAYILSLEGYIADAEGAGGLAFMISPVVDGSSALTIGALVTGQITAPGQVQRHLFHLNAVTRVYFDSRTANGSVRWSLTGPGGALVTNRGFSGSDGANNGGEPILTLPAGDYTLTVDAQNDETPSYQFRVADIASAETITTGSVVSGTLDPANETDLFHFSAVAGSLFYFDQLSLQNSPNAYWRLISPSGRVVFQNYFADVDRVTLRESGIYTLLLEAFIFETDAGSYSFSIRPIQDGTSNLLLGSVVEGNIGSPGQVQTHLFTLTGRKALYFDALSYSVSMRWSLTGPAGAVVTRRSFASSDGLSFNDPVLILEPGNYSLTVDAATDETGAFRFRLMDLAAAAALTPGTPVSGGLNPASETDAYRFSANAGDRFSFESLALTSAPNAYWRLYDPYWNMILRSSAAFDAGTNTLPATGTYTFLVEGYIANEGTGTYQFNIVPKGNVPPPVFTGTPITLGATVSGNLATGNETNSYVFSLGQETWVFFDGLTYAGLKWTLQGPTGVVVEDRLFWYSDSADFRDSSLLLPAGAYQIQVTGSANESGAYSFRLLDTANATLFTPGTVISGSLTPGKASTLFRFNAQAGDRFFFDGRTISGFTQQPFVRLYGPERNILFTQSVTTDEETFAVSETGQYLIAVEGRAVDTSATGNFSFLLQPVTDGTNTFQIGATVTGSISMPGQRQFHRFTLGASARLVFDSLANSGFPWSLEGTAGDIVDGRQFWNSDSVDGAGSWLELAAGEYWITVDPAGPATGDYSFRLLDTAGAVAFTPGVPVSGSATPARSTVLYRFEGTNGSRYYFDGRPATGFQTVPYARLLSPSGKVLFSVPVSVNFETFSLTETGNYILTVEGRYLDASATGNFSFNLVPNPIQPPVPILNSLSAADLIVSALTVTPSSGVPTGGSVTVNWTVQNTGNLATDGAFSERVTLRNTSNNQVIADRVTLYDQTAGGVIGAGQSRARQLEIVIPDGPSAAGTLEVTVTTDTLNNIAEQNAGGTAESNNSRSTGLATTLAPYPDLEVTALSVVPVTGWLPGGSVTVNWTVRNSGTGATSGSWIDRVTVRNTNTTRLVLSTTNVYNAVLPGNGAISPAGTRDRTLVFSVPNDDSAYGAFEITVTTDQAGEIFENNGQGTAEGNNTRTILTGSAPDLQIANLAVTATPALLPGGGITIQWSTVNHGTVEMRDEFYDRVTIRNTNTSEVLANGNVLYQPTVAGNGPIPPGGSRVRQYVFPLPDRPEVAGRLEITVTADFFNHVPEYNSAGTGESNNSGQTFVTVASQPYPDLIVTSVTAPVSGVADREVPVVWTLRNQGTVVVTGAWSDQIFLSTDNTVGNDQYLESAFLSATINAGASLTRTQLVTLPPFAIGPRYFVVKADGNNQIAEESESNNAGIAAQPMQLLASLTLSLAPAFVAENSGNQASRALISRSSDTGSALVVTVGNSAPGKVLSPATVIIPAGATSTNFYLGVADDAVALGDVAATITATAANHIGGTNVLTVRDDDLPALALQLSASSVAEGAAAGAVTGRITRNTGTNQSLVVRLSSDRPGALTVPATVIIPAGGTNAIFPLNPVDDAVVTGNRAVVILASADGFATVSQTVTVTENDTVTLALEFPDATIEEGAVHPALRGMLTRTPVLNAAQRIRLRTTPSALLLLPAEVTIPANQPGIAFDVDVRDDNEARGPRTASIIAEAVAIDGTVIPNATRTAFLTVLDNDGPTLSIETDSAVIPESGSTQVHVMRNTPPTNSLTVNLTLTPSGQAVLPTSVVIPAGLSETNVTLTGVADGIADGAKEITISASAPGFNTGEALVSVTDINVPDLTVAEIVAPAAAVTDGLVSLFWTVTNIGLATASAPWVDHLYLAKDAQGANADFIASVTNVASVPVGDSYSQSRSFLLPSDPGTYWVLIQADGANNVAEGTERNNSAISHAITVQPSYRATVNTDTDAAISGTPIPLRGRIFFTSNNGPAPFRTATVRINVRDVRRTIQVQSDANGDFQATFQPIPGEAGVYTIGADHPRVRTDLVQDQFTLMGMAAIPWEPSIRLAPGSAATGDIELRNLSPLALTGLTAVAEGVPALFNVALTAPSRLDGNETNQLHYVITTTLSSAARGTLTLVVRSAEGAVLRIPVNFTVAPPAAQLVSEPALLQRGMLRGTQSLVSFDLINQGGAPSGNIAVSLPVVPWLSLVSASPIPTLLPGERTTVVLALNPAADLPLTRYNGNLVFNGNLTSLSVPFEFRAVSEARGDLLLTFTDEHTYFVQGAPKVTNGTVALRDPITTEIVAQGATDANGVVRLNNLLEGDYMIDAFAPKHAAVHGGVRVTPGVTTEQEVFLSQETVTYEWKVVPTQIEDHYRVVIEPLFETEVPQPSLVIENPQIAPLVIPGRTTQFEIRMRNTGLIALKRIRVPVPNHPKLVITPIVSELDEIPALSTLSVPVTIRLKTPQELQRGALRALGTSGDEGGGGTGSGACAGTECVVHIPIDTRFRCGTNWVVKSAEVKLEVVCVPDTGCNFEHLDLSHADFFDVNVLADRAEWDCLMGNMDECQKARIRGYIRSGEFGSLSGPMGFGLSDFCACGPPERIPTLFNTASNYLASLGFSSGGGGSFGTFSFVAATLPGPCNSPFAAAPARSGAVHALAAEPKGVCAKVRLQISQDITLTRNAFRGTLILENNGDTALNGIQLSLDFRDANQQSASELFAVRGPTLAGLTAVDGSGAVAAHAEGSAEYIFIPTLDAAPTAPRAYYIGGTLRYLAENGEEVVVPLLPAPITVLPEARLVLEYFQQRDVFADDPFTPEIEPSEPFALGLRVKNAGAGVAHQFRISSSEPKIIENEKGLLIDFKLVDTRLNGEAVPPSLTLNLGEIDSGQSKVVIWNMISSLQGKFIDYRASFEHLDALGNKNLSLIQRTDIHEMIHVVRADGAGDDALPDFLVNDQPDAGNLPDTVYLSDGRTEPVALGMNPTVGSTPSEANPQARLTVSVPGGWCYVRLPNPGTDLRLTGVRRSDGKVLRLGENVWTTDRTFPASQAGAVRERTLHIFDRDSTGDYNLIFAPVDADLAPPVSSVAALPATSPASFAVQWSGDDGAGNGIAFFDIFVSVNGGAFTPWLGQTTLRSAVYAGVLGNTYAFKSQATDAAGNQEATHSAPDAQTTTAASANLPPVFTPLLDLVVDEGVLVSLTATATDADTPAQTLTFGLNSAPAGATIAPASGAISWPTGESQGGTTNRFTIVVTDNGLPPLSATQTVNVIVREVNSAPSVINAPPALSVNEGSLLTYLFEAADTDLPVNQLSWELGAGAPAGLTLNANTGELRWLPGEPDGPGLYNIIVTVRDNGVPRLASSRVVSVAVNEANQPPVLAPIPAQHALVGVPFSVTASATDTDRPEQEFFYSLNPGSPRGARIDHTTGVFEWTPAREYGASTNIITVRVTDSGIPSLTATQPMVVVIDNYFQAVFGEAISVAGQPGAIPLITYSSAPVTNASLVLTVPGNPLGTLTLAPPAAPLSTATLQSLGNNRYQIHLSTLPGSSLVGQNSVSEIRFTAAATQSSAFVPFVASNVASTQSNGQPMPSSLGGEGRVILVGPQPLLEIEGGDLANPEAHLTVYGRTGQTISVETSPTLASSAWIEIWKGNFTQLYEVLSIAPTNRTRFYRARTGP